MRISPALLVMQLTAVMTNAQQPLNLSCYDTQFQSPLTVAFNQFDWNSLRQKLRSFKRSKTRSNFCVLTIDIDYDRRTLQVQCKPLSISLGYDMLQLGDSGQLQVRCCYLLHANIDLTRS